MVTTHDCENIKLQKQTVFMVVMLDFMVSSTIVFCKKIFKVQKKNTFNVKMLNYKILKCFKTKKQQPVYFIVVLFWRKCAVFICGFFVRSFIKDVFVSLPLCLQHVGVQ